MKKIKLGFIGYGKSANRYHLPYIDKSGSFEVVGYYSRSEVNFEMPYKEITPRYYNDLEDLLKEDLDLVVVVTPNEFHYEYGKKVLNSGKNVLIDKPITFKLEELKELYEIAEEKDLHLIPYQNRRYDSDFLTFKEVLERKDIGRVLEIESNHTQYRVDGPLSDGGIYDGFLYGHGIHFIDQIVSILGKPDSYSGTLKNHKNYGLLKGKGYVDGAPEDHYDIKLNYKELSVRVRYSPLVVKEPPRWIINSTKATYEKYMIDQQERDLKGGVFPKEKGFGVDTKIGKLYKVDGSVEDIETIYGGYDLFYDEVAKIIDGSIKEIVKKEEILTTIGILEDIAKISDGKRKVKK